MNIPLKLPVLLVLLVLAGCQQQPKNLNIVSSPYSDGVRHTEPVFYNGKNYTVSFAFAASRNAYDVTVAGKGGRQLGGKPGDRTVVEQLASSAIGHFACPNTQKGRVVPGSASHSGGKWNMQARCV